MPKPRISVVIPAYNEELNISATLQSLVRQRNCDPFEVIVVNNASTDNTRAVAQSFTDKLQLTVIDEPTKGRGTARATGFDHATGDIIFSLDADSVAPPNWIAAFMSYFNDPKIVAITGTGRITDVNIVGKILLNISQPLATFFVKFFFGARWLTGFNFAIRKSTYQQVGGFNRDMNAQEDAELGFRVQKVGSIKMAWKPQVVSSGRRFKEKGIIQGVWQYIVIFRKFQIDPANTFLDDPR